MTPDAPTNHSAWQVLRYPTFFGLFLAQFISLTGSAMQVAAVDWHIWDLTHDKLKLAYIGLMRVVPVIALALLGGVVADAIDRRKLLIYVQLAMLVAAAILALSTLSGQVNIWIIYAMTAIITGLTAFESPAQSALLPNLVPPHQLSNAVRLNTLLFPIAAALGPLLAGLIIHNSGPGGAYVFNAVSFIPPAIVLLLLRLPRLQADRREQVSLAAAMEGLRFVRSRPLLWGSMILDSVAMFFGSALALLPIYADEILKVDAFGYGLLRASPFIGAAIGVLVLAQVGSRLRNQGKLLLWSVAGYGLATVIFGFSSHFLLSFLALAATGLMDAVSMMIRSTLRQLLTPDRLRGRMISVGMVFYLGGPQLGEFEAGVLAQLTSTTFSVVFGGVCTVLFVAYMAAKIPALRHYDEPNLPVEDEDPQLQTAIVDEVHSRSLAP